MLSRIKIRAMAWAYLAAAIPCSQAYAQTVDNLTTPPNRTIASGQKITVKGTRNPKAKANTGTINNGGTITINKGGALQIGQTPLTVITLTGGGPLALAGGTLKGIETKARDGTRIAVSTLINDNNTIRGTGTITTLNLKNNATINSNVAGATLEISDFRIINSGTLQASGGGTLSLFGGGVGLSGRLTNKSNAAGQGGSLFAGNGSTVNLDQVAVEGGFLDTQGTGTINGTGEVDLKDLTVNGAYNVGARTTTGISGRVRNNGAINVPKGGTLKGASLINGNKVNAAAGAKVALSSYSQTGGITVADGSIQSPRIDIEAGTLTGTGSLTGAVAVTGGTLRPGDGSPGILTINGGVNMQAGSTFLAEIDRNPAGPIACNGLGCYSQLDVTGGARLDDPTLSVMLDSAVNVGDLFAIIDNLDGIPLDSADHFAGLFQHSTFSADYGGYAYQFEISYDGNAISPSQVTFSGGNDVVLEVIGKSAVPEPSTLGELVAGVMLLGFGVVRRRG